MDTYGDSTHKNKAEFDFEDKSQKKNEEWDGFITVLPSGKHTKSYWKWP